MRWSSTPRQNCARWAHQGNGIRGELNCAMWGCNHSRQNHAYHPPHRTPPHNRTPSTCQCARGCRSVGEAGEGVLTHLATAASTFFRTWVATHATTPPLHHTGRRRTVRGGGYDKAYLLTGSTKAAAQWHQRHLQTGNRCEGVMPSLERWQPTARHSLIARKSDV